MTFVDDQNGLSLKNLLLVDDDVQLGSLMTQFFNPTEFCVTVATTGEEGIAILTEGQFSIIILDVMLPGIDGFEALRKIRAISDVPVLMLTTRGSTTDRVNGLESGADDYLPKPFQPEELQARVRTIVRRSQPRNGRMKFVSIGDLELDEQGRKVKCSGEEIELTGAEFVLLQLLVSKAGSVQPREALIQRVFERQPTLFDRSIDSLISNLRRKLGPAPDGHDRIRSIRGLGYAYAIDSIKEEKR